MKKIRSMVMVFLLLVFGGQVVSASNESKSLQTLIDQAKPGDTLTLSPGQYVGHATVTKPLKIVGDEGVEIVAEKSDEKPVLTIEADDVVIEHLSIMDERDQPTIETIFINSDNNELNHLSIETKGIGIQLDDAHHNTLSNISMKGNDQASFGQRGNGIDLWESNYNTITSSKITDVQDGVYLEDSRKNNISKNEVTHSRYGYHLMFTEQTNVQSNQSFFNISGIMVMGTEGTVVEANHLQYNQKSVQSLGLLLFDVKDGFVANNVMADNRIGLYVESSMNNDIQMNESKRNYIGLQLKKAEDNHIVNNSLTANVVQGQAEESSSNDTNGNYWDDHFSLDTDGDGVSNLTYKVDPFYLSLTEEYPAYQLFFQAPGLSFLEQLFHTPTDQWVVDHEPLMEDPLLTETDDYHSSRHVLFMSTLLFIASITIIYLGVRKR